jgi:2-iminobutanoate/2-iminopropanoate deaminase
MKAREMFDRLSTRATHPAVHQADALIADHWLFTSGLMADDGVQGLAAEAKNPPDYPFFEAEVKLQVRYILRKIKKLLNEAGADFSHVVKAHAFLTHPSDFVPLDEAWGEFFPNNVSRTFVATETLPVRGARVCIDVIACLPGRGIEVVRGNAGASPAFSRKVEATRVGDVIFTSGQLGYDSRRGFVPEARQDREDPAAGPDVVRQARFTLANLAKSLEAVGGDVRSIAKTQIYLTDMEQCAVFSRDWNTALPAPGALTTVGAGLFVPEGRLEVDLTGFVQRPGLLAAAVGPAEKPAAFRVGNLVFCSGQSAIDEDGFVPLNALAHPSFPNYASSIKLQTRMALEKLDRTLKEAGGDLSNVARAAVFLTDYKYYSGMNEVWLEFFKEPCARTVVATPSVGARGALIAVDAMCIVK